MCNNLHIDEEPLQQAFLRAIEVLRKNKGKLEEKWASFSEEQRLEKYHAAQLKELLIASRKHLMEERCVRYLRRLV